jgi:peptide/nickel transport system ATP-binding protein
MKAGRIVESGRADNVYLHPKNEYTRTLIEAVPKITVPRK